MSNTQTAPTTPTTSDASDEAKKWAALIVAGVLLVIYLILVFVGMGKTDEAAESWARRVMLLGGIEGLAFAGAGWLFGKEVSRQTIQQANARANDATAERDAAKTDASEAKANAVAMAQSVKTIQPSLEQPQRMGDSGMAAPPVHLADAILARYGVAT